ncbi:hypothetical protein SBC1_26820 [Caballeronia sp. SBC1]|uniref:hypothetical protein n=1 Tax=Caballeronia sp. SBC1 TaxID=2705548 RepID=UPI00140B25D4|nr:hypothetical protein [Caballeronia sp. SBC1]QIN62666.1 hypothetical protein SBC1_26820 [Caballeronia sp. SBC1]
MWVPDIGELLFSCSRPSYSPPNQRCRWFVVYGGYAAFDTSPPAIIVVAKADFPIVAHHAFFLTPMIFRDDFRKVIRRLGKIDSWTKFDFFTTPAEALEGATPLQWLSAEDVKSVVKEAATFAEQYARLFP